jgi:hypothetical protein
LLNLFGVGRSSKAFCKLEKGFLFLLFQFKEEDCAELTTPALRATPPLRGARILRPSLQVQASNSSHFSARCTAAAGGESSRESRPFVFEMATFAGSSYIGMRRMA